MANPYSTKQNNSIALKFAFKRLLFVLPSSCIVISKTTANGLGYEQLGVLRPNFSV